MDLQYEERLCDCRSREDLEDLCCSSGSLQAIKHSSDEVGHAEIGKVVGDSLELSKKVCSRALPQSISFLNFVRSSVIQS
ncbi:hypothetical protein MHYP_G00276900 [Metynnis hypsauchen]